MAARPRNLHRAIGGLAEVERESGIVDAAHSESGCAVDQKVLRLYVINRFAEGYGNLFEDADVARGRRHRGDRGRTAVGDAGDQLRVDDEISAAAQRRIKGMD